MKKLNCKAGDMVCISWDDAVSYPRVDAEAGDVPLARFETFGLCGYVDKTKIVILHERELSPTEIDGTSKKRSIEPTALPLGMIQSVKVFRPRI